MNALDLEIRRRNARLRAWAASGLSVEGRWVRVGKAVVVRLACQACREGRSDRFFEAPAAMASFERRLVAALTEAGCSHLGPLLEEDPEAIRQRARMELLSGTRE